MRERLLRLLGTTGGRLLALLVLAGLAISIGGLVVVATHDFDSYPEAAWWPFRHVVDPGALAGDVAWDQRIVGTLLVVVGIVVLVGIVLSLISDMVQQSLQRLDETQVTVNASDHIVVLGWSWLVPLVLDQLEAIVRSEPALRRAVVVVAPAALRVERDRVLSELRSHRRVFPTHLLFAEDDDAGVLELARVTTANSVLVVRNDTRAVGALAADVNVITRAALLADHLPDGAPRPTVTYHLARDESLAAAAETLPADYAPVVGDRAITGLLRLALFSPPWGRSVIAGIDEASAMDIDVVRAEGFVGRRLDELAATLPGRLALGIRSSDGRFSTAGDRPLAPADVVLTIPAVGDWSIPVAPDPAIRIVDAVVSELHILIVGWNDRVPTLIDDLAALGGVRVRVTSASELEADARAATIPAALVERTRCRFLGVSLADPQELAELLESVRPDRVVVVSPLRGPVSDPERELAAADARAVIATTALTGSEASGAEILVDLSLPASAISLRRFLVCRSCRRPPCRRTRSPGSQPAPNAAAPSWTCSATTRPRRWSAGWSRATGGRARSPRCGRRASLPGSRWSAPSSTGNPRWHLRPTSQCRRAGMCSCCAVWVSARSPGARGRWVEAPRSCPRCSAARSVDVPWCPVSCGPAWPRCAGRCQQGEGLESFASVVALGSGAGRTASSRDPWSPWVGASTVTPRAASAPGPATSREPPTRSSAPSARTQAPRTRSSRRRGVRSSTRSGLAGSPRGRRAIADAVLDTLCGGSEIV